ncbi:MAG: alkaline phosphatase family protein [Gammaproteobacteria bacterium]|nr:alkaline phosphatase family protein [Gammaproteobacteria bacterium]MBK8305561.1 alkaline phosphatase family protein [Gammaproteobacteria bacterium]
MMSFIDGEQGSPHGARRLALIGFDGMDATLVRQWAASGHLPEFARLLDSSGWCQFDIAPEYSSGMVWPTINTGLPPAVHNANFGSRLVEGSYSLRPRKQGDIRGAPFWRELAAQGRRLLIMDVPFCRVDPNYRGLQLAGWGGHEWSARRESWPTGLLAEIDREFGPYPIAQTIDDAWEKGGAGELIGGLLEGIERRTKIIERLSGTHDWEFLYTVFHEAHSAGHCLWHLGDPHHPRFSAEESATHGNGLLRIYQALDTALGCLLRGPARDVPLAVMLSHGMGPNYNGNHLLPGFLARFDRHYFGASRAQMPVNRLNWLWESTIAKLPPRIRYHARLRLPMYLRQWLSSKRRQNTQQWRSSAAFALPGLDGFSALRVNLRGREPQGMVAPGTEYDDYLASLCTEIHTWTTGVGGHKAVASVHRAAHGSAALALGPAPDLMIWWSKEGPIEVLDSPALGTVSGASAETRSGEHVMHSLLLLRSPGIAKGACLLPRIDLVDVAPTLLELAGAGTGGCGPGRSRLAEFAWADNGLACNVPSEAP